MIPDYNKPYRTGTYSIGTSLQNKGWNYARVIHRIGATNTETNYVEWVVDPSGSVDDTAVTTPTLSNFNHSDVYYQSGIGYFASNPSGTFDFEASNFYRNVYSNGNAISFPTTTYCEITNVRVSGSGITTFDSAPGGLLFSTSMPALNGTAGCETTSIQITGTVRYDGTTPSISGSVDLGAGSEGLTAYSISVNSRVLHPLKSTRTTSTSLQMVSPCSVSTLWKFMVKFIRSTSSQTPCSK